MKPSLIHYSSLACIALVAAPVAAQCTLESTYEACFQNVSPETAVNAAEPAARTAVVDKLAATNTGPGDSATQNDFVAKLGIALDSLNFGENGEEGLTFDWSGFVSDILGYALPDESGMGTSSAHKLTVRLNEPTLFEPLAELLTAEQKTQLAGEVGDLSDKTVKWSFSPVSRRFGRDFSTFGNEFSQLYQASFAPALQEYVAADVASPLFQELLNALRSRTDRILAQERALAGRAVEDLSQVRLDRLRAACLESRNEGTECPVENVGAIVASFGEIHRAQARIEADIEAQLNTGIFDTWQKLLDNQRQLVFSVEHTRRETLAGRDETTGKFTYEFGHYNMADFMDYHGAELAGARCIDMLDCLTKYRAKYGAKIDLNLRFSLSAEYVHSEDFSFARAGLPGLQLDDAKSVVLGAALSRNVDTSRLFSPMLTNGKKGRAEFALAYDDVDDDAQRNDRFLARLVFTQQVRDGTNMTLGFVYSSKPEYRGQVDKEISARFGLNYKFGSAKP